MKPAVVAQTLLPSLLKIAALSRLPVPTRLLWYNRQKPCPCPKLHQECHPYLWSTYAKDSHDTLAFHSSSRRKPHLNEAQEAQSYLAKTLCEFGFNVYRKKKGDWECVFDWYEKKRSMVSYRRTILSRCLKSVLMCRANKCTSTTSTPQRPNVRETRGGERMPPTVAKPM